MPRKTRQKRSLSSLAPGGRSVRRSSTLRPGRRRAAILVALGVTLMAVTVVLGVLLSNMAAVGRTERQLSAGRQVRWLAEAGVNRAMAMLAIDADYDGERWAVPAGDFIAQSPADGDVAQVQIIVERGADDEGQRMITVQATLSTMPADHPMGTQMRHTINVHVTLRSHFQ